MTGLTLAQYRIDAELGRGGMGIVYRATDTKLNRTVALKILPASVLSSEEDRSRFFREAQAAAQLHHPHIATVFQIDEAVPVEEGKEAQPGAEPRLFIAMEYIDGETLQERIARAPLPLPEAVGIATQIGEALRAAHGKEIVHRDIKSANVMLTKDGIAKVLDFGLAKTNQSTMLTRQGSTLGTVAYMSPEQARGQQVDGRTDLYSLGTVLYEMVAGRLPFAGDYEQAILYGILNENPEPLTALRTGVPMALEFVANKLLAKEPDYRYQTAADLLADLKSMDLTGSGHSRRSVGGLSTAGSSAVAAAASASSGSTGAGVRVAGGVPKWTWGAMAVVLLAGLGGGWLLRPVPEAEAPPVRVLDIPVPEYALIGTPTGSPDGRYWAITGIDSTGTGSVTLWDLRTGLRTRVPGDEPLFYPQFSPSGKWVMLSSGGNIHRMLVPTGRPIRVDSAQAALWLSEDELLVIGDVTAPELARLAIADGSRRSVPFEMADTSVTFVALDSYVAGANVALLSAARAEGKFDLLAVDVATGSQTTIMQNACCGRVVDGRYLVYLSGEQDDFQVVAQPFDADALRLQGVPVDIVSGVSQGFAVGIGQDDTFFHVPNFDVGNAPGAQESLSWLDPETGTTIRLDLPADDYGRFDFNEAGDFIVIERVADGGSNLYTIDLATGTRQRLTYLAGENRMPTWSKDDRIYYSGGPPLESNVYVKNADGSGEEQLVVENADFPRLSPDGRWLVFMREENGGDIVAQNLASGDEIVVADSKQRESDPIFSPNGRFVAYSTDPDVTNTVSNDQRVVVRSFPDPTVQYVEVVDGFADDPIWSPDGEYLYLRAGGVISRIRVSTEGAFRVLSEPRVVGTLPGPTIRLGFNAEGRLLVMHPGQSLDQLASTQQYLRVIESFTRYLDELLRD